MSLAAPDNPTPTAEAPPAAPVLSQSAAPRCLILANPKAGALKAMAAETPDAAADAENPPDALTRLSQAAHTAGLTEAVVREVPAPEQLPALLQNAQAEGIDTIVAAGGDGTVRTIAQALIGSPLRLGILPMGTANNIARSLGLPFDLDAALAVVAENRARAMDAGRIGTEYFLEAAGVGLFADAIQGFGADEPHPQEWLEILRVCAPLCWNPRARHLELILDGVPLEEETIMVTVANAAYLGASMAMAPDASLSDGLFDVVIVGALTRWEMARFGLALLRGRHLELEKVRRVQARTVEIRRRRARLRPLPIHADDHIAAHTPARLEVVPNALRVLVGPAASQPGA